MLWWYHLYSFIHIEDTLKRSEITWQMYPIRIETVQSELFNHKIIYSSVLNVSHINVSASNSNRIIVCDRIIELFKKYFSRNIGPLILLKEVETNMISLSIMNLNRIAFSCSFCITKYRILMFKTNMIILLIIFIKLITWHTINDYF